MGIKEYIVKFMSKTKEFLSKAIELLKGNFKIFILVFIIVSLFLGYFVGNIRTTRDKVLRNLEIGLEEGKTSKLTDVIRVDGKKVSKKDLAPLVNYYKGQDSSVKNIIDQIKIGSENCIFNLVNKKSIFGNDYYVNLKTFNLKVLSNLEEADILINKKKKVNSGDTLDNLIPGKYTISGSINNKYGKIKKEEDITLMKDETVNLNLDGVLVTVNSDFKDASVLINGKDSGIKVCDFKNIGPMPTDGSIKLSIEQELPWGVIKGKEHEVLQNSDISLNLDIVNDKLWDEVNKSLETFYKSVFESLNNEDKNLISGATDEVKNKIYRVLEQYYLFMKNKYEIKSLNIDKEKSSFKYKDGQYMGTVVCDVQYDTSKAIFGFNKKENSKKFLTKVLYKNGTWIIYDIENFSL